MKGENQKLFSLKKQTPHSIVLPTSNKEFGITTIYHENIEPITLINISTEKIISSNELYHLKGFMILSWLDESDNKEKLKSFSVFGGAHPNADPKTHVFCMPDWMEDKQVNDHLIHDIRKILRIWNLLSCFFIPEKNTYESVKT